MLTAVLPPRHAMPVVVVQTVMPGRKITAKPVIAIVVVVVTDIHGRCRALAHPPSRVSFSMIAIRSHADTG